MSAEPDKLAAELRLQAVGCRHMGSDFYAELLDLMAADVEAAGPVWDVLGPYAGESFDAAYRLRLLGGVHSMVLAGDAPALAAHYPTAGGDGDVGACWPAFRALLATQPATVADALTRPPQTNEVGRSASLAAGLAVVASRTALPVRLLELGSSGALNLRLDAYWYEQGGERWGDGASAVRFVDCWAPGAPPFSAGARIVSRRGCDRDPIDATSPDGARKLLSYVWPGQDARFTMLRDALAIAARFPVEVDRADAASWLPRHLDTLEPGGATVVMHSVFWQYLTAADQAAIRATLAAAGARASAAAPLFWLRLEPVDSAAYPDLRLTAWPGGAETLLATASFHFGPVRWLA